MTGWNRAGWQTTRIKHVAAINERALPEDTDPDRELRYIDISAVGRGELRSQPTIVRFEEAPSRARRCVREGDTIVSTVRTYLRAVWTVPPEERDATVSTGFAVLSPTEDLVPRFFSWWLQSDRFIDQVVARSVGVSYPAINPLEIGNLEMPSPTRIEQIAIANLLDTETTRIDALITKKRRMIDLVRSRFVSERATAILGFVDPTSGSGPLPPGWTLPQLGVLIELQRGHDLPSDERREGAVPIVSSGGISGYHDTAAAFGPGVVTGRYGSVGTAYYVDGPYWPLNTTLYVRDFRGSDPRWVRHLLNTLPLDAEAAKTAVTGINRNVIGALRCPAPPRERQRSIAKELDAAEVQCNHTCDLLTRQIDLLVEHRQALITAAVTGEVDIAS